MGIYNQAEFHHCHRVFLPRTDTLTLFSEIGIFKNIISLFISSLLSSIYYRDQVLAFVHSTTTHTDQLHVLSSPWIAVFPSKLLGC